MAADDTIEEAIQRDDADDSGEMPADEIDGSFVPRLRTEVASVELDGESVLLAEGTERVHWLDRLGTIVLNCFDGVATLDELVADLSEAFGADPEVVRNDVVEMTRQVGRAGLLEGVAEELPQPVVPPMPESLEVGTEIPAFSLPELGGGRMRLEDVRGRQVLLVNWSPACGFCVRIAPELGELRPEMERQGVELVLLTMGDVEENRRVLEEQGLECTVLIQEDGGPDLFAGVGTPAAYLLDEEGRTATELAVGADLVPKMARSAAGLPQEDS